jgi:CHAD domain-containing protein
VQRHRTPVEPKAIYAIYRMRQNTLTKRKLPNSKPQSLWMLAGRMPMATLSTTRSRRRSQLGLRARMNRFLKALRRVRKSADGDAVHDLRVAIRRCRSVASVMVEVDGHRTWRAMKRLPRKLFCALGALRDLQVLEVWVKQLASADDPLRTKLLELLDHRQAGPRDQVRRALRNFDRQGWKHLARQAPRRASVVTPNSLTAQCLALERYEEFHRLHARAVHTETPAPWHALRVGLKRFRYAVETLLPERSAEWHERLGQMQNLLGEIHDLDVLRSRITQESDGIDATSAGPLRHAIATKRRGCIEQYRKHTRGDNSLLREWRAGLPHGKAIEAATAARLHTTARAMDPHPRQTAIVSHLALLLFDGLATSGAEPRFRDATLRSVLGTAAQLHAIRVGGRQAAWHKAARDFLRSVPAPLGCKPQEWDLVIHVVRYHRGAEPATRHKQFMQLSREQQDGVRGLAGVLRLARGLHRCGLRVAAPGIHVDATAAYIRVCVVGMQDTEENAARLGGAKHLLERYLRRPLLIHSAQATKSIHLLRLAHSTFGIPHSRERRRRARGTAHLTRSRQTTYGLTA